MTVAASAVCAAVQHHSYISKRDREFVGPDERLERLLKQRMAPPSYVLADLRALENSLGPKPKPYVSPAETRRIETKFHEYNGEHLKVRILQFQQYLIHLSKGFITEIETVVEKYQEDDRVRVAYTFGQLRKWLQRIRTLYEGTIRRGFWKSRWVLPHPYTVFMHYYFYQHMLRIHVDITYTVEFLVYYHTRYRSALGHLNYSSVQEETLVEGLEDISPEQYGDVYDKLQGRNMSDEELKIMLQAAEEGVKITLPPL